MADTWICSQCRSLNEGAGRCYKCRTPRALAGVRPEDLPTIGQAAKVGPAGRYRSSALRAIVLSAFVLGLAASTVINVLFATIVFHRLLDGQVVRDPFELLVSELVVARDVLEVGMLIFFAAWLSRVVDNIPPLTGSYPQATPRSTIFEVLIPFFNFFRIPAILRDVLRLLEPRGNGAVLVGAAALPLILGLVLEWPIGNLSRIVIKLVAGKNVIRYIDLSLAYAQVLAAFVAIGSVFLIAVIVRIERLSRRRNAELRRAERDSA